MKKEEPSPFSSFILRPSCFRIARLRTIAHLSDIHFDLVDPAVIEALVRDLNGRKPDLLVVSGDLTQRARVGQFRRAMAFLDRLPKPRIVLAGNHDVPLFNVFRRVFSPMGRFRRLVTPDLMPVYQDAELLVIGLNTAGRGSLRPNGFWKDGSVDPRQLEQAVSVLRAAPREVTKILVTHHPFASHDEMHADDTVRNADAVLKSIADCGVGLLLAGHLHHAYHAEVAGGAISLQAGTACSIRRREQPNNYNWITAGREGIDVEIRAFADGAFAVERQLKLPRQSPPPIG